MALCSAPQCRSFDILFASTMRFLCKQGALVLNLELSFRVCLILGDCVVVFENCLGNWLFAKILYGEGGDVRWIEKMESLEERISYVPSWKVAALDLRFVIDASTDPELRLLF
jgi:hypothetical protein